MTQTVPDILKENKIFLVPTTEAYCNRSGKAFFAGKFKEWYSNQMQSALDVK